MHDPATEHALALQAEFLQHPGGGAVLDVARSPNAVDLGGAAQPAGHTAGSLCHDPLTPVPSRQGEPDTRLVPLSESRDHPDRLAGSAERDDPEKVRLRV